MRTSDWSSDVCSSDLQHIHVHEVPSSGVLTEFNPNFPLFNTTPGAGTGYFAVAGLCTQIAPFFGGAASIPGCITTRTGRLDALKAELTDELARLQNGGSKRRNLTTLRSEEHTSELQSLMRISYAVFCLKKTTSNTI